MKPVAFTVSHARGPIPGRPRPRPLGHTIRTPRYRYTEWLGGKHGIELYDYQNDPLEITNLAKSASHRALLAKMKTLLKQTRARTE